MAPTRRPPEACLAARESLSTLRAAESPIGFPGLGNPAQVRTGTGKPGAKSKDPCWLLTLRRVAARRIANPPQVDNLPHMAAGREQTRRFSNQQFRISAFVVGRADVSPLPRKRRLKAGGGQTGGLSYNSPNLAARRSGPKAVATMPMMKKIAAMIDMAAAYPMCLATAASA